MIQWRNLTTQEICRRLEVGQGKRVSLSNCLLLKITISVAFCAPRPDVSIVLVLPPAPAGQLWMIRRHKMKGTIFMSHSVYCSAYNTALPFDLQKRLSSLIFGNSTS